MALNLSAKEVSKDYLFYLSKDYNDELLFLTMAKSY